MINSFINKNNNLNNNQRKLCGRLFDSMQLLVEHLDTEHLGQHSEVIPELNSEYSSTSTTIHICLWQGCQRAGKEFKAKYKLKVIFLKYFLNRKINLFRTIYVSILESALLNVEFVGRLLRVQKT
ncbi:unnamed protein product [Meloidogyne enterolobii]|uniref:Uncharacterized protein n=1 Tax=Meloidogyne enterolobii TaxID=390850 RepID=A0ACB0YRA6_MELEN